MSNRLLNLAWLVPVPASTKLVLIALADRANDAGKSWPSREMLCAQTGLSQASVSRHVDALVSLGVLIQQRRRQRSAEYTLDERGMIALGKRGSTALVVVEVSESESEKAQPDMSHVDTYQNDMYHSDDQEGAQCDIPKENPNRTSNRTSARATDAPPDRFPEFWDTYPKRGGKQMRKDDARKAWGSVLKALHKPDGDGITWTVDQIIDGARRYARECECMTDREFVKTPGPWLRAGCWKYEDATASHRDPAEWLRGEWKAGRATEVQKFYRVGYVDPPPGDGDYVEDVLKPYNRAWIEQHRDAILTRLASEAS